MTVLIFTNKRDLTVDYVVRVLKIRGAEFIRINTEEAPKFLSVSHSINNSNDVRSKFFYKKKEIHFNDISGIYFRRPGIPEPSDKISDEGVLEYCKEEWLFLLKYFYELIPDKWLNHPLSIYQAENKPKQLLAAKKLGFLLPNTLITNRANDAINFIESHEHVIAKPLKTSLLKINNESHVIFTSRLNKAADLNKEAFELSPSLLQEEILKGFDLRVTVIGEKLFSVKINSQVHSETQVDWRCGSMLDLDHTIHHLPPDLELKCIKLIKEFGLKFGALDFVIGLDGNYYFLELNPNGQWAWIQEKTGLALAEEIANNLLLN